MTLTLVHLREDAVPKGGERIEWLLITTLPVGTVKQAQKVVDLYALRWRIEEYHRILTHPAAMSRRSLIHRRTGQARRNHQHRHRLAARDPDPARTRNP